VYKEDEDGVLLHSMLLHSLRTAIIFKARHALQQNQLPIVPTQ